MGPSSWTLPVFCMLDIWLISRSRSEKSSVPTSWSPCFSIIHRRYSALTLVFFFETETARYGVEAGGSQSDDLLAHLEGIEVHAWRQGKGGFGQAGQLRLEIFPANLPSQHPEPEEKDAPGQ